MKKLVSILILVAATIALSQSYQLNQIVMRRILREWTPVLQIQKNKIEDIWNAVDRPLKTNATMLRVSIVRTVVNDTNGIPVLTNYNVTAVDNVRVKLVED